MELLMPLQRYKFESNSQQIREGNNREWVVNATAKIQIWKQFTAQYAFNADSVWLLMPLQRYKFESNSQHDKMYGCNMDCC